jgi:hypothetical protein
VTAESVYRVVTFPIKEFFITIILALTSLSVGIYFLYLLAKAKEESRQEETV